jgi:hypothetical protein
VDSPCWQHFCAVDPQWALHHSHAFVIMVPKWFNYVPMVLGCLPNAPGATQHRPVPPPSAARPSAVRQHRSIARAGVRVARRPGSHLCLEC